MKFQLFTLRRSKLGIITPILIVACFLLNSTPGEPLGGKYGKRIQKHDISIADVRVTAMGLTGANLEIVFNIRNPSGIAATLDQLHYKVYANNIHLGDGKIDNSISIPADSNKILSSSFVFNYSSADKVFSDHLANGTINWKISVDLNPGSTNQDTVKDITVQARDQTKPTLAEEEKYRSLFASLGVQKISPSVKAKDFTLENLEGSLVSLKDFQGKIVFLNFWATWCPPCRAEMPGMEKLWQNFKEEEFIILAVNVREGKEKVSSFIKENSCTFPVLLDSRGEVANTYSIRAIPTTYLIDPQARIVGKALGARNWAHENAFKLVKEVIVKEKEEKTVKIPSAPPPETKVAKLYFADSEAEHLVPEERKVVTFPEIDKEAKEILKELIKGPLDSSLKPTIPLQTEVEDVYLKDDCFYVNFSLALKEKHPGGSSGELLTIYSIVNTLLINFPSQSRVQILIQDKPAETLAGYIDIRKPLGKRLDIVKVPHKLSEAICLFEMPVNPDEAYLIQEYGVYNSRAKGYHTGIDLYTKGGKPTIHPTAPGTIVLIQPNGPCSDYHGKGGGCEDHGLGNTVIIEHVLENGQQTYSLYAHLDSIDPSLSKGIFVDQSDPIGTMGASGYGLSDYWKNSDGTPAIHLHFEIKDQAVLSNPKGKGTYFGYVPAFPDNYGYHNPYTFLDKVKVSFPPPHLNAVITSSLKITPPPYRKGDTINAQFTIANKGRKNITFKVLTVGGRDPDGQVADFTFDRNITLRPNESYKYKGTLTLAKPGNYHFFCAYQTLDGKWNPSVDLRSGLTDEDRIEDIIVKAREETKPTLAKASSGPEVIWSREFYEMVLRGVQQTPDGGYILVGDDTQEDFIGLIKTDPQGQKIWEAKMRYRGPWVPSWTPSFQQTSDGGYILLAQAGKFGGTDYTMYLIKTDATGHKIWDKGFDEKDQSTIAPYVMDGHGLEGDAFVQETPDGGYILGGSIRTDSNKYQPWLMETNSKGDIQWEKIFEEEGYVFSFQQTSDRGYILGIAAKHGGWLIKTDSSGRKTWKRIFEEKGYYVVSVQETSDGGYILAGSVRTDSKYQPGLMKINSKGEKQWERTFEEEDYFYRFVQQTSDRGYILAGNRENREYNVKLIKTDAAGQTIWEWTEETEYHEFKSFQQTPDGGYILLVGSQLIKVGSPEKPSKKQITEVTKELQKEEKKEKEELFPYRVEYKPVADGSLPFLLLDVRGPADELGIILTNPKGWSTTTFISRRDLIDNFESVRVRMCEGRNPPAGTYKLVIKTITPEKVVYKTEARFTPPAVEMTNAEIKFGIGGGVYTGMNWVDEYSITVKNWGELPIFLDRAVIIIPGRKGPKKIEIILVFAGVPHGESKIEGGGPYYFEEHIPSSYNTKIKLYSEGNEVANSSSCPVKVTTK